MKRVIIPMAVVFSISLFSCNNNEKKEEKKATEDTLKTVTEKVKEEPAKAPNDETYLTDEKGQWAISAKASSTYASKTGKDASWSPEQMIGEPNVKKYGDNGSAWASKEQDKGEEWVKLSFAKEVNATEVRIKETFNPGAITKIELFDNKKKSYVVYESKASKKDASMQYLVAKFDKTPYKTKTVKITLDSPSVSGWNEIDAVQLVGE